MSFNGSLYHRVLLTGATPSSPTEGGLVFYIDETVLPSKYLDGSETSALAGGGDIRVALDNKGSQQLPCYVRVCTPDAAPENRRLRLYFRYPNSYTATSNQVWLFCGKSGESQPAVDAPFGRNEVFQDHKWTFVGEPTNATGSGNDLTLDPIISVTDDGMNWPSNADGKGVLATTEVLATGRVAFIMTPTNVQRAFYTILCSDQDIPDSYYWGIWNNALDYSTPGYYKTSAGLSGLLNLDSQHWFQVHNLGSSGTNGVLSCWYDDNSLVVPQVTAVAGPGFNLDFVGDSRLTGFQGTTRDATVNYAFGETINRSDQFMEVERLSNLNPSTFWSVGLQLQPDKPDGFKFKALNRSFSKTYNNSNDETFTKTFRKQ